MIENPAATSRKMASKSAPITMAADPCGNYYVNVFFHFIRDNNGATGQSVSNIPQYMNILNGAFNGQNVFFVYKGNDEIRNSTWSSTTFDFGAGANFNNYNTTNLRSDAINVYLFRTDNTNPSGVAARISNQCAIGGGDTYSTNYTLSGVLAHEVGHCLSLLHTHHGTDPLDPGPASSPENPNGSNGATAGDFISDTPADPNINQLNAGNCTAYSRTVGSITYNPNPQNYMSYATPNCLSIFTNGQGTQFRNSLDTETALQAVQQISTNVSGNSTLCSSSDYTLLGVPPGATITWTVSSNIQINSGQGTTTVNLQPTSTGSGVGTISATISVCNTNYTSSYFQVSVGVAPTPSITIAGVAPYGAVDAQAYPGYTATYNWYRDGSFLQSTASDYATLNGGSCGQSHYMQVSISNSCGTTSLSGNAYYSYSCSYYRAYPNPTKDYLELTFDNAQKVEHLPDHVELLSEKSTIPVLSLDVQNAYISGGLKNGNTIEMAVKDFPRGTYYLRIKNSRREDKPEDSIRIILE